MNLQTLIFFNDVVLSYIQLDEGKKHAEVHICVFSDALNPIPMQGKVAVETHLIIFSMIGWRDVNLDTMTSRSSSLLSSGTGTIYEGDCHNA